MIKVVIFNIQYQSDIILLRIQKNVFKDRIVSFSPFKINVGRQITILVEGLANDKSLL